MNRRRAIASSVACSAVIAALSGCSDTTPLAVADKARFRAELIDPRPECGTFRESLLVPGLSGAEVDAQYLAARRANCLRPEV